MGAGGEAAVGATPGADGDAAPLFEEVADGEGSSRDAAPVVAEMAGRAGSSGGGALGAGTTTSPAPSDGSDGEPGDVARDGAAVSLAPADGTRRITGAAATGDPVAPGRFTVPAGGVAAGGEAVVVARATTGAAVAGFGAAPAALPGTLARSSGVAGIAGGVSTRGDGFKPAGGVSTRGDGSAAAGAASEPAGGGSEPAGGVSTRGDGSAAAGAASGSDAIRRATAAEGPGGDETGWRDRRRRAGAESVTGAAPDDSLTVRGGAL